jgi:hypothetical protein
MGRQTMNLLTTRRGLFAAAALGAAAVVMFVLIATGPGATAKANGTAPAAYADYSALSATEASDLPLVTIGSPTATQLAAKGPVFPADPTANLASHGPVPSSIKKLTVSSPNVSAWIAESGDGGICVMASRHHSTDKGSFALGIGCVPAELVGTGAMVELQSTQNAGNIVVGAVPDGVSSVEVELNDGNNEAVPVTGDAWSLETDAQVQATKPLIGG